MGAPPVRTMRLVRASLMPLSCEVTTKAIQRDSPHLLRHHSNWRIRAIQQSENLSAQELMYTAGVSLSKQDFNLLREEMVGFIKRFLSQVHASPAEEIACLNLDFFWIKK